MTFLEVCKFTTFCDLKGHRASTDALILPAALVVARSHAILEIRGCLGGFKSSVHEAGHHMRVSVVYWSMCMCSEASIRSTTLALSLSLGTKGSMTVVMKEARRSR